jgi:hypothetical protein
MNLTAARRCTFQDLSAAIHERVAISSERVPLSGLCHGIALGFCTSFSSFVIRPGKWGACCEVFQEATSLENLEKTPGYVSVASDLACVGTKSNAG